MITKTYGNTKNILIHVIGWIMLFILPPFISSNFERISSSAPEYYYFSCFLLIPFFYINRLFLLRKRGITFIIIVVLSFLFYLYFPGIFFKITPPDMLPRESVLDNRLGGRMRQGLSILFLVVLAINILEIVYRFREISQKARIEKTVAELTMLKAQIDPHFLFNSLNSIYYEAIEKTDVVPKAIMSLSNLMRYVLTDAKSEYVSIMQEVNYLKGYLELQQLRLPEKTSLNFCIKIDSEDEKIAPLLLIPFIENAFKYGVSATTKAVVKINLRVEERELHFQVENKIFYVDEARGTKTGLSNVKKRLELIYPNNHKLNIINKNDFYKTELFIKLS